MLYLSHDMIPSYSISDYILHASPQAAPVSPSRKERCPSGGFASWDFDVCLRNFCGTFAENCGDLRRLSISASK